MGMSVKTSHSGNVSIYMDANMAPELSQSSLAHKYKMRLGIRYRGVNIPTCYPEAVAERTRERLSSRETANKAYEKPALITKQGHLCYRTYLLYHAM